MDRAKNATPPTTPSRASSPPLAIVESRTVSIEPPRMDNSDDFTEFPHVPSLVNIDPPQMLMQTSINIECGPKLQTKLTVHEEMLCCHSKPLQARFLKAKSIRQQFVKADDFRDQLAAYVFPETTPKEFEDDRCDEKAKPLIRHAAENYPLLGFATGVKKIIVDAVAGEISAKNIKKTAQKPAADLSLASRLELLKPQAVQAVAAKLFARLHAINKTETRKAEEDPLKAAVQYRIILPDVEEATLRSLMQYIHRGSFQSEGSEQVYAVMKLAEQLGVDALATKCLNALYNTANTSLKSAISDGISLQTLLGYSSDAAPDDIVGVVFKHAIKDKDAPKELKGLVIDTLAACLDPELWMHIRSLVSHEMALQIIEAMVGNRQHVKVEVGDDDSIKSEREDVSSAAIPSNMPIDSDEKPSGVQE